MAKINKHIEIVSSTRVGLSSMTRRSREGIKAVLSKHYAKVGITLVNNLEDLETLVDLRPDVVFLGMKFIPGDPKGNSSSPTKIWISHYLEDHDIAYTGSSCQAIELELNKELAKQEVLDAGLKTPHFCVVAASQLPILSAANLPYPVFIKPTNRGGGQGIDSFSVAHDYDQARFKVQSLATDLGADSLMEEYLPGREFSVAILRNAVTDHYWLMPIELIAPQDDFGRCFLSSQVKSTDSERHAEVTDAILKSKINTLALAVFQALGARDYGRIDIRLDSQDVPHFLEANLLPSLLDGYGNFPKACLLNNRLDYEPMILRIVELALERDMTLDPIMIDQVALSLSNSPVF